MKTIVAREIIQARIIGDYTVELVFDDLKKNIVDFRKYLGKGIFKELLDKKKFHQMKVDAELGTVCWPNGADIAPDTLYSESPHLDRETVRCLAKLGGSQKHLKSVRRRRF
ncbi:MAG: DUF2442 domain-containing protein [Candidatus Omnitrophota bacterium]|nr:DUF2442 domain-containing protein [Candidatus Omnitrophota bacterium]